jgi:hypothetical protein
MDYPELLQEIKWEELQNINDELPFAEQEYQISPEAAFAIGKVDGRIGATPAIPVHEKQAYNRGYVLGLLERFDIPEKDRDFRSEF